MQRIFLWLSRGVLKKPVRTVLVAALLLVALVTGVLRIFMATGNETFIKSNTDAYRNNAVLEETFGGENIVVLFTGSTDNLLTIENLYLLENIENKLTDHENVYSVIGPATVVGNMTEKQAEVILDRVTAMKDGLSGQSSKLQGMQHSLPDTDQLTNLGEGLDTLSGKLLTLADGLDTLLASSDIMHPGLPQTERTLQLLLYDDGELRPIFSQFVLDDNHALLTVRLTGNASDTQIDDVVTQLQDYFRDHPLHDVDVTITGKPVLDVALRSEMKSSMQRMVLSALVLMVIIVSVVFKVRWRLFPLAVNFAAVVATMGLMGHLGIPMTMVSMAAFPILIGLGIDYSIQFHSRYEEEFTAEEAQAI